MYKITDNKKTTIAAFLDTTVKIIDAIVKTIKRAYKNQNCARGNQNKEKTSKYVIVPLV